MSATKSNRRAGGFTLVEMLVVIAIIALLAALLLPALSQGKARAKRIECVSDLKEMGLAYHLFASDHNGRLPTQVSTNDGGASEFVAAAYQINGDSYFSYRFVVPLAGTLTTPKLFACPSDLERPQCIGFNQFNNTNFSYDVGLVRDANDPGVIVMADRGLPTRLPDTHVTGTTIRSVPVVLRTQWTGSHGQYGNILFGDSHVDLSSQPLIASEEAVAEDVAYPSVKEAWRRPIAGPVAGGGGGANGGGNGGTGGSPGGWTTPGQAPQPAGTPLKSSALNSAAQAVGNRIGANNAPPMPNQPAVNGPTDTRSGTRSGSPAPGGGHGASANSSSADTAAVPSNGLASTVATSSETTYTMSPSDRRIAHVLRTVLGGSYLLILLALLLYAAYRYWLWKDNRARRLRRLRGESDADS